MAPKTKKVYEGHQFQIKCKTKPLIDVNSSLQNDDVGLAKSNALKSVGFFGLTGIKANPVSKDLVKFMFQRYDNNSCTIKLSDAKELLIQERDIQRVYKLPAGPIPIKLVDCPHQIYQLRRHLGIACKRHDSVKLEELQELMGTTDDPKKYAQLYILFALGSLLCHISNPYVSLKYAKYVGIFEEIPRYNWSRHVLSYLLDGLSQFAQGILKHPKGDVHFLMVHFLDCVGTSGEEVPEFTRPSCSRWANETVDAKMKLLLELGGFEKGELLVEQQKIKEMATEEVDAERESSENLEYDCSWPSSLPPPSATGNFNTLSHAKATKKYHSEQMKGHLAAYKLHKRMYDATAAYIEAAQPQSASSSPSSGTRKRNSEADEEDEDEEEETDSTNFQHQSVNHSSLIFYLNQKSSGNK